MTERPYYFDPDLLRRDIRDSSRGAPLILRMQVVTGDCAPIGECDAQGIYSGYARQAKLDTSGQTFPRGTQFADDCGMAEFPPIWPGWYPGRATHIHFKVMLGQDAALLRHVMTCEVFFDETFNRAIYAQSAAYRRDHARDIVNANDGIARQAGPRSYARVSAVSGVSGALAAFRPPL